MSNRFGRWWCTVSIACVAAAVGAVSSESDLRALELSEYWRMPRVFKYDDYDICLNDNPTIPSVYCVVKAVIRPDNSSEVWSLIERISSKWKVMLNHAHLDRGVCVRDCEMRLQHLSGRLNGSELLVPKFNTSYRRYSDLSTMIVINGTQIVTTFFAISAMLLVLFFMQKVEETKKKVGIAEIFIISVARYVRLTPVYAFVMLFEATWVVRLADGPLWQKGFETGRSYCRKNWWVNLLYINNYYKVDEPCMLHTWYLAADFHLFVYGLVLCAVIARFPKVRNALLGTLLVLSYLATAAIIYLKEYDAIPIFAAEQIRYFFWYWDVYRDAYVPSHMYLVNYTFAIACAFYYMHLAKTRTNYHWGAIWAASMLLSYLVAWVLCLVLESPFMALQRQLFKRHSRSSDETDHSSSAGDNGIDNTYCEHPDEKSYKPNVIFSQRF
uniref:Acyltransferase 3 domain-containing protein n=1 Tax=Anopheles merus TaxID=30066 RepID=A0A182V4U1_ANOME